MLSSVFYCMDCLDAMREFPDKFFSLAVVDVPYGIGASRYERGGTQHGKSLATCKEYGIKKWDDACPDKEYFNELFRISKHQIIWGIKHYDLDGLGNGLITYIDRQDAITKGKFNLILSVEFELGQSCVFSKLLSSNSDSKDDEANDWIIENKSKFNDKEYKELIYLKSKSNLEKIIELLLTKIPDRNEQ